MENINEYKKRFYNLMGSTLGDAKPLISEQGETPPFIPQTPRTSSPNSEGPDTLPGNTVDTQPTSPTSPLSPPEQPNDGKKEYINKIRSLLSSMENSGKHNADTTAQIIVNNTNYFLTRQREWSDINKYGKPLFSNSEVKYLDKD